MNNPAMDPKVAFQQAAALHRAGHLSQAIEIYRAMLRQFPGTVQLLNALGIAELQRGNTQEGVSVLGQSLDIAPDDPDALCNRGLGLYELGRLEDALAAYDRALALRPGFLQAHVNRGNVLLDLQRPEDALAAYDRALALDAGVALAHYNRGRALRALKRLEEALAAYDRAVAFNPRYPASHGARGQVLKDLGRHEEALEAYDRALAIDPRSARTHYNRGSVLLDLERFADAITSFDVAVSLDPTFVDGHVIRGRVLEKLGRYEEAIASFGKALARNPTRADVYNHRGNVFTRLKRFDEALADCDRVIALEPTHADAHWNKALIKLLKGDFEEGLPLYEWRWERAAYRKRASIFAKPLWIGQPLAGKTLLIHGEQGFGDFIQMCRYVPMVNARKVVLEAPKELSALFATLKGRQVLVEQGKPLPEFDLHCPVMSLPLVFQTTLASIPAEVPYLFADPEKKAVTERKLGAKTKPRVGLCWSGSRAHADDKSRSIALSQLAPVLELPFEFHALQSEIRAEDRAAFSDSPLRSHASELKDFSDTAALIAAMDLVVTVDTAVAHLAGALGKPVWILLPFTPDWRWLLDREDSPWYPSARLFRQPAMGDWESVVAEICRQLKDS